MKLRDVKKKMKEMTQLELESKLNESKEELFNLRFQIATGNLEDFSKIRQNKKQVARILTIMNEKK
jgi:large subunit ribosomal protein L29